MTTPRDSYAWNYRDLATLVTLNETLAAVGFEPLTIRLTRKKLFLLVSYVEEYNAPTKKESEKLKGE